MPSPPSTGGERGPSGYDAQCTGKQPACDCLASDPETGVVPGLTRDRNMRSRCRCSMCPAIHTNSRSWLRSSSTHEPSDPPLRAVFLVSEVSVPATGATLQGEPSTSPPLESFETVVYENTKKRSRGGDTTLGRTGLSHARRERSPAFRGSWKDGQSKRF